MLQGINLVGDECLRVLKNARDRKLELTARAGKLLRSG
jgi:hypothetical protein